MREILLNAGFTDAGPCSICTSPATQFKKRVNNKEALVKVRDDQRKFTLYYNNDKWMGQYRTDVLIEDVLANVIKEQKLV